MPRGTYVIWDFIGSQAHRVVDGTGMDLYDSGRRSDGASWHRFRTAGTYPYVCLVHPSMRGRVSVPAAVSPRRGQRSTVFTVTWSTSSAPEGTLFDVQIKRPGTNGWRAWKRSLGRASASFKPVAGTGTYRFRARMRDLAGADAGWSPAASIRVR